jgi:UDPglucose--hexose-1-phosphate uridylyltransferase
VARTRDRGSQEGRRPRDSFYAPAMPELRDDPLTGELVLLAPSRAARPHTVRRASPAPVDAATCPFCEGHEAETPPEVARVGGGAPNGPGWRLRAFPNLYPIVGGPDAAPGATGVHEVVVLSPEHDRDLARLSDDGAGEVFALLRDRSEALAAAGRAHVQVSVNHGAAAGASIAHPHAQILALDFVPPAVVAALTRFAAGDADLVDADATRAEELETVVLSHGRTRAWCAAASSAPYEVRVADRDAGPRFAGASDAALPAIAVTVRDVLAGLASVLADAPYNVVVHDAPTRGANRYHWWIRIIPRVGVPAGFELGTGVLVESVDPRRAADALRTAMRS